MGITPRGHIHHPLPLLCVLSFESAELRPGRGLDEALAYTTA